MKAKEVFHGILIQRFSTFLRGEGFARKGLTFVKWVGKNARVINFQPSKWSNPHYYEFTVNLGVLSARIYRFETEHDPLPKFPDEARCHYRERLGPLIMEGPYAEKDQWWALDHAAASRHWSESGTYALVFPVAEAPAMGDEVVRLIKTYGFPALERYGTDERLRDLMLEGQAIGQSDIIRLWYLSILLLETGAHSELGRVLVEFRALAKEMPVPQYWERRITRIEEKLGGALGRTA